MLAVSGERRTPSSMMTSRINTSVTRPRCVRKRQWTPTPRLCLVSALISSPCTLLALARWRGVAWRGVCPCLPHTRMLLLISLRPCSTPQHARSKCAHRPPAHGPPSHHRPPPSTLPRNRHRSRRAHHAPIRPTFTLMISSCLHDAFKITILRSMHHPQIFPRLPSAHA